MAKKVQLTDLKIKSFVVQLNKVEQKTAKGGLASWGSKDALAGEDTPIQKRGLGDFTEHKSQRSAANFSITRRIR